VLIPFTDPGIVGSFACHCDPLSHEGKGDDGDEVTA
jgi:hypothetical protein